MYGIGGRRLDSAERERIVTAYFQHGMSAADKIAVNEFGLSPNYAYKLLNARGLLPRGLEDGGRQRRQIATHVRRRRDYPYVG